MSLGAVCVPACPPVVTKTNDWYASPCKCVVGLDEGGTPVEPPTVSGISPTTAAAGSALFTLTVTGTGFTPVSVVTENGNSRVTTFVSDTQLTAEITPPAEAGTARIRVTVDGLVYSDPADLTYT